MTVHSTGIPEFYVGNGVTTVFTYHSRVLLATDMAVFVNNVQLFSGYSVALIAGGQNGATVTITPAPIVGAQIELSNEPPVTQEIDYLENTAFPANVQEFGLDKLTLLLQGIRNIVDRTIRRALRVPSAEGSVNELPARSTRAGSFLLFDANGQPTVGQLAVSNIPAGGVVASIAALRALAVPIDGTQIFVSSYYGLTTSVSANLGGGVFRFSALSAAADDRGTIIQPNSLPAAGRWLRLYDGDLYNSWFGTVGDGISDDTAAWQACFDTAIATGRRVVGVKGNYLVAPLFLNGSAWVANGKPVVAQNPCVRALSGQGPLGFGCRFVAKPGSYPNVTDCVLTAWNIAGVLIEGIAIDGGNVACRLIDTRWFLSATANGNSFRDWWCENAKIGSVAVTMDGAADGPNANINYRGGTTERALSIRLAGGVINCTDINTYKGRMEINCQNMMIDKGFISGGIQFVGGSYDDVLLTGVQVSEDDTNGYVFYSNQAGGFFTGSLTAYGCFFLGGANFTHYFAGAWATGGTFIGCHFLFDSMFDTANWTVIGGTSIPTFTFINCTFGGSVLPVTIPGVVNVHTQGCRRGDGIVITRRDDAFGREGFSGHYGLDQTTGVVPANATFGQSFNRLAGNEVEQYIRGNRFIITDWDGATAVRRFVFDHTAGNEALYPSTTALVRLGNASNRWSEVFAANGVINTSNEAAKTSVSPMSAKEIAAAKALAREIGIFQFLDSIDKKGKDGARMHVGMTVQRVEAIMREHGLDPWRYGFMCHDKWDELVVQVPASVDEEGNVTPAYEVIHRTAGEDYGFRTDQLLMFIARGMDARLTALEH